MLYDRPIHELMKDAAAELLPPYTVRDIIDWFAGHYPKVNPRSVRAHVIGLTANDPNRHHYQVGRMPALFVRQADRTLLPVDSAGDTDTDTEMAVETAEYEEDQPAQFVLEAHLEEFLVGNWASINWGRQLEIWAGPDGESGHQLSRPIGRLDFLCTDESANALVVVELKRGRPSDKVVGQIARYIGYVREHMAVPGQAVEGLIVAHDSDDHLRYAVAAFPGLSLMTYKVSFQLSALSR